MGIIQLINTINSLAKAVPEIADLCETLVHVAKDYEQQQKEQTARERWRDKNAAIDAALANVEQLRKPETEQHTKAARTSTVQVCGHCGTEVC